MTSTTHTPRLRPSEWAMGLYGYTRAQRSGFWQFVKANGIPYIKAGKRKCLFSEEVIFRDLERRTVGGRKEDRA